MTVKKILGLVALIAMSSSAFGQDKPNFLIIWGDDIGISNISAYSQGMMGYETPNIDRIADEGMLFTTYYGEQSCTAGRASFMLGQSVFRSGLSKVGFPGADKGINILDPTVAGMLKDQGYFTAQFGKNHFGDQDKHLPTNHGFDEFFGNLYHLNAEEEPEDEDYPGDMVLEDGKTFAETFGPRGVIKSSADGQIADTGPLTRKRMETVDEETLAAALDAIERAHNSGQPFFIWWNGTRMHFRTHLKDESRGRSGLGEYIDGMIEHDGHVGQLLDKLDELGITDNTFVMYSTDNGPHKNTWPDAATSPFRNEKNSNWEGAFRVPAMVRWPGRVEAGSVNNEIVHHMDWFPTFLAMAGYDSVKEDLLNGVRNRAMNRRYKVHLDGYNILPMITGETDESPRKEIYYFSDVGDLTALRYENWKLYFSEMRVEGTLQIWLEEFTVLRTPMLTNLRTDPYEEAMRTSNTYYDWMINKLYLFVPAQFYVKRFVDTFEEYPPRMRAASFSVDQVLEKLNEQPNTH